jgi:protein-S-isoprenylcysteine O-methyltransferase Ste14
MLSMLYDDEHLIYCNDPPPRFCPYRLSRHPLLTGLFLAFQGTSAKFDIEASSTHKYIYNYTYITEYLTYKNYYALF